MSPYFAVAYFAVAYFAVAYFAVAYFAAVGDRDRAFGILSELGRRRESCLRDLAVDPTMDALRGDPRFHDALRAVALD